MCLYLIVSRSRTEHVPHNSVWTKSVSHFFTPRIKIGSLSTDWTRKFIFTGVCKISWHLLYEHMTRWILEDFTYIQWTRYVISLVSICNRLINWLLGVYSRKHPVVSSVLWDSFVLCGVQVSGVFTPILNSPSTSLRFFPIRNHPFVSLGVSLHGQHPLWSWSPGKVFVDSLD